MEEKKKNVIEKIKNLYFNHRLKNSNPYFLDFPVGDKERDYIGFNEQVDCLYKNIRDDAKIIGIVADYGSGKSTVVNMLSKKIKSNFWNRITNKYKLISINLWNNLDKDNCDALSIHKRFLYQLAYQLRKNTKYINKKLNTNYGAATISAKNKHTRFWIFTCILLFFVSVLNKNHWLHYINFLPSNKYEELINFLKMIANFSGIISLVILVIVLLKEDIIFSFFNNNIKRSLSEEDSIEIYLDVIASSIRAKKFNIFHFYKTFQLYKPKKLIIAIEDLDRINREKINEFLQQIYVFYSHTFDENISFIIAIKPEDYLANKEEHYKIFNYIVDLQKIKIEDFDLIFKGLLKEKRFILESYKINIESSYWNWLTKGSNLNIRQLKHRYNDTILLYKSLQERFPLKKDHICLENCIAVSYLKNEYPNLYPILIEEKTDEKHNAFSTIGTLLDKYILNKDISIEELWDKIDCTKSTNTINLNISGDVTLKEIWNEVHNNIKIKDSQKTKNINDHVNDNNNELIQFKIDVYDLLKNRYITDNYRMYFYSYPMDSYVPTSDESNAYNCYIYNKYDVKFKKDIETVCINKSNYILNAVQRLRNLKISIPDMIFENAIFFDYLYNMYDYDEKKYISRELLKLDQKTSDETLRRLNNIKNCKSVDIKFIVEYISSITKDFRMSFEDIGIINIRKKLTDVFKKHTNALVCLFHKPLPIISEDELDLINNFDLCITFIEADNINDENIKYIASYINKNYQKEKFDLIYSLLEAFNNSSMLYKLIYELNIYNSLSNDELEKIKNDFQKQLRLDDDIEIMHFINKTNHSFEDLEKKLIMSVSEQRLDKNVYCDFWNKVNSVNMISMATLEYLASDDIDYGFNPNIINLMYKNKLYMGYVKSRILYTKAFTIEENKLKLLKGTYILLFKKYDMFEEFIENSPSALDFYRKNKVYNGCSESKLMLFKSSIQDPELLNYICQNIKNQLKLNAYFSCIKRIEATEEQLIKIVEDNSTIFESLPDAIFNGFYNITPKGAKLKSILRKIHNRTKNKV